MLSQPDSSLTITSCNDDTPKKGLKNTLHPWARCMTCPANLPDISMWPVLKQHGILRGPCIYRIFLSRYEICQFKNGKRTLHSFFLFVIRKTKNNYQPNYPRFPNVRKKTKNGCIRTQNDIRLQCHYDPHRCREQERHVDLVARLYPLLGRMQ